MNKAAFIIVLALGLLPTGAAFAHNSPTIRVDPPSVAAGAQLTVLGKDMSADLEFAISLERIGRSIPLGTATATPQEGGEAGFTVTLTVPANTPPGSYTVRAQTQSGKISATADLTVTTAAAMMPSGGMAPMSSAMPSPSAMMPAAASAMAAAASAMPSAMPMAAAAAHGATAEEHQLPRDLPKNELFGALAAAVASAGVGALLVFGRHA